MGFTLIMSVILTVDAVLAVDAAVYSAVDADCLLLAVDCCSSGYQH